MKTHPWLWLYGPSGVGKTTTAWHLHQHLTAQGHQGAYLDADQLGLCYPPPPDDEDNHSIKSTNLAAAWQNFHKAGAQYLILSGYISTSTEVQLYKDAATNTTLTLCRLRATRPVLEQRFIERGWLLQYLSEALEEAEGFEQSELTRTVVETDGLTPTQIAQQICAPTGPWPMLPVSGRAISNA